MKISINWDLSGSKEENIIELVAFALNKDGVCKNSSGVIGSMQPWTEIGITHKNMQQLGSAKDDNKECVSITINKSSLPYYCKEIILFAYNNNGNNLNSTFKDLDFFNVFLDDQKIFSKENFNPEEKFTGMFLIGNIVKHNEELHFSEKMNFINKDLIKVGKDFDIIFEEEYN